MRSIIEYLYPPRCPVCDDVRPPGDPVCHPACRKKLIFVGTNACVQCGKPVPDESREYCYDCSAKKRSFEGGVSTFVYEDAIRESMMKFKYHGREEYGSWYAEELWHANEEKLRAFAPELIVPVPVHPRRYRQRGYNQAAVLAEELGKRMGVSVDSGYLRRTRHTKAQKQLNDQERIRNLMQAFEVRRGEQKRTTPKRVVLVDDIYTTGSTLEACTRVLKKAGVQQVMVATVCIGSGYT